MTSKKTDAGVQRAREERQRNVDRVGIAREAGVVDLTRRRMDAERAAAFLIATFGEAALGRAVALESQAASPAFARMVRRLVEQKSADKA